MNVSTPTQFVRPAVPDPNADRMDFDWPNRRIVIAKSAGTKAAAQDIVDFINAVIGLLPDSLPETPQVSTKEE